ncbi:polysaccharide deacetylase family protein [Dechloromonas denitrificans]|nr:polysaccharide deacetylase family protein [Dechloromonas denitrificans]UCV10084.1 polysaccharide deacetylase family protein [Dechloromonas denitrificans]
MLPFEPSAEQFNWMARFIARNFNVLTLSEAARRIQNGTLPAAAAVITFDDGYADNLEVAWPILNRYGIPATFFIATSFLDGGRMWNDEIIEAVRNAEAGQFDLSKFSLGAYTLTDTVSRVRTYETILGKLKYFEHVKRTQIAREIAFLNHVPGQSELMMTSTELKQLHAAGAEIGAHTQTHPILELLDDDKAFAEIEAGKIELESILGEAINVFAYPNGVPGKDCSVRHGEMVKKLGFQAAVTTEQACASASSKIFHLPRFTPWDRTPLRFAARSILHIRSSRH